MSRVEPISKRELLDYRAEIKSEIFRQIRKMFQRLKQTGFTQKDLAKKLGIDEGLLSRRMRGENDMRLETFSDLARGLDCMIDVKLTPLTEVLALNKLRASIYAVPWKEERPVEAAYMPLLSYNAIKDQDDLDLSALQPLKEQWKSRPDSRQSNPFFRMGTQGYSPAERLKRTALFQLGQQTMGQMQ